MAGLLGLEPRNLLINSELRCQFRHRPIFNYAVEMGVIETPSNRLFIVLLQA
jgi:hypothetical protein